MAFSRITRIGNGSATTFSVNFPLGYLSENDVTCRVGTEVDGTGAPSYREITFVGANLVQVGGAVVGNLVPILFERTTAKDEMAVVFEDGNNMDEVNLDVALKQAILIVHEVLDGRFAALSGNLNMNGFQMQNMGTPLLPTDGANKAYVDGVIASGAAFAAAAASSAQDAAGTLQETVDYLEAFTPEGVVETAARLDTIDDEVNGALLRAVSADAKATTTRDYLARRKFSGCLVNRATDTGLIFTNGALVPVPWDNVVYDYDNWWDITGPTRFYVPNLPGLIGVRFRAAVNTTVGTTGTSSELRVTKNETVYIGWATTTRTDGGRTFEVTSGVIPATTNDRFAAVFYHTGATALGVQGTFSSFSIEAVFGPE